jgi:NAD(P)-dependent dehydrogenase (short-subunit alcohol dehydrogenase family)
MRERGAAAVFFCKEFGSMRVLRGTVCVITGGADGIGRGLALRCAREGAAVVVLADLNAELLARTAKEVEHLGVACDPCQVDVANREQVKAFAAGVRERHGGAALLVNNAGVAVGGNFLDIPEADFDWLLGINLLGVIDCTRAFLPMLKAQPEAHVVNISSVFGIIAPAQQTAYATSKFAVRGFTEALRHELDGTSVHVSVVHPGGIRTQIAARARINPAVVSPTQHATAVRRFERLAHTTPERAGDVVIDGVLRNAPRILIGYDARLVTILQRLFPVTYWRLVRRQFGLVT